MYKARESLQLTFNWEAKRMPSAVNGSAKQHRELDGFKLWLEMEGGGPASMAQ